MLANLGQSLKQKLLHPQTNIASMSWGHLPLWLEQLQKEHCHLDFVNGNKTKSSLYFAK